MKAKTKTKKKPVLEGYMCFSLHGSFKAQRSSYDNKRREEVHEVRKVGACLRCQLLKKTCSKGNPCTTCLKATSKNSNSRSLAWMECITPSLLNVSIYGVSTSDDQTLKLGGVPVLQYLAHGDMDLAFDIPFQWQIDELTTFVAGWLIMDHDAPRASMVGIMSSASLLSLISDLIGPELAQAFKTLIYTSSLIFNAPEDAHYHDSNDVKVIGLCGQKLLAHLDSHLRPATLARLGKHDLYALFLLLLGCVMSSRYVAESIGDLSHHSTEPSMVSESSNSERGTELVKLLSHQMVYIGQNTGLLQSGADKDLIRDLSSATWQKKAAFTWEQTVGDSCVSGSEPHCEELRSDSTLASYVRPEHCISRDDSLERSSSPKPSPRILSGKDCEIQKQRFNRSCRQCSRYLPFGKTEREPICKTCDELVNQPGFDPVDFTQLLPLDNVFLGDDSAQKLFDCPEYDRPSSPLDLDIDMAMFDPNLPTHGFEEYFFGGEDTSLWPCLNRVPTPTGFDFGNSMDCDIVVDFSMLPGNTPTSCSGEVLDTNIVIDTALLESPRRRLLL